MEQNTLINIAADSQNNLNVTFNKEGMDCLDLNELSSVIGTLEIMKAGVLAICDKNRSK